MFPGTVPPTGDVSQLAVRFVMRDVPDVGQCSRSRARPSQLQHECVF